VTPTIQQRRASDRSTLLHPCRWVRWVALVSALFLGVLTTAQNAHLHRPAVAGHHLQSPAAGTQAADTEEHCPLCVAMHHVALLPPMQVGSLPVVVVEALVGLPPGKTASGTWHFARFGRPPPVLG
jgi:hypothetical protein